MRGAFGTSAKRIIIPGVTFLLFWGFSQARVQKPSSPDLSSHLGLLGFTLGKSTLADVRNKLGASNPGACSTEVEASKVVCYVSGGPDKTRVLFASGFAGGWSSLDGFKVTSQSLPADCHLHCKVTQEIGREIRTTGGLRLGLTRDELVALLGDPTETKGDRLTFRRASKRPMTKSEIAMETEEFKAPVESPFWDVQDTIFVVTSDSKVVEFEVQHIVSY